LISKTNWENDQDKLNFIKVYSNTIPIDIFEWLKNICLEAQNKNIDARDTLAGHLREEYYIRALPGDKGLDIDFNGNEWRKFEQFVEQGCFSEPLDYMWSNNHHLSHNRGLTLISVWANFQKKYEFNPPHIHSGVYSFIIFVNIPYNLEDEIKMFSVNDSTTERSKFSVASKLYFQYVSPTFMYKSNIARTFLNVDKSYEGKIIIFPSDLEHAVHPFYTSNDYRITISGNLVFRV
tara:strand:- start:341 stop:1045 length:705 start_codon:yes stop_codon:yes gene_type:complete